MHYYKRNIGDYHKKAGRLSMLEHGSYTLLLDACYDREQFPTLEEAMDWAWARTDEEEAAVRFVLRKFFVLEDGRYIQKRIQEELLEYQARAETNARIAKDREQKRKNGKPVVNDSSRSVNEACPISHEPPPNHKPLTTNHKPLNNTHTNASEFLPDLAVLNNMLKIAGGQAITKKQLEQTLVTFIPHYEVQRLTENQRMGKLVAWIMRDQKPDGTAKPKQEKPKQIYGNVNSDWNVPPPLTLDQIRELNAKPIEGMEDLPV